MFKINYLAIFGCIVFILGFFFIIANSYREGFDTGIVPISSCPNLLIKKDGQIYLYNTKKSEVPGVNPIIFQNLEDYSEFLDWQRANGIHCPVLNLEKTYDTQGNEAYKVQTSILDPQGGLPPMRMYGLDSSNSMPNPQSQTLKTTLLTDAGRDDPSYNWNSYPGFDPQGQNIGQTTPQDAMDTAAENNPLYPSPNPMDPNWGGGEFSQTLVDKGYYKGNEVDIYVP